MCSTDITAGSALGDFVGPGLGCMGIFPVEEKKLRSLFGVEISTASMTIFGRTGVVGLGATGSSSLASSGSSSTTLGIFFVVRGREVLVVGLEGPALGVVVRVAVRADVLGGGLTEGGFFDGGFAWTVTPSTTVGRTPGGLPRLLGTSVVWTSVAGSTSMDVVLSVDPFCGTFSALDDPVATLDRVTLAFTPFFLGSDSSGT